MQDDRFGDRRAKPLRQKGRADLFMPAVDTPAGGAFEMLVNHMADIMQQAGGYHGRRGAGIFCQGRALQRVFKLADRFVAIAVCAFSGQDFTNLPGRRYRRILGVRQFVAPPARRRSPAGGTACA